MSDLPWYIRLLRWFKGPEKKEERPQTPAGPTIIPDDLYTPGDGQIVS